MNVSATLSIFRLLRDPSLCLPHCTISTFQQLPIPISQAFTPTTTTTATTGNNHNNNNNDNYHDDNKEIDIRAIVLDKDNCFARPGENEVYQPYQDHFHALREAYPGARLLIVSNSAGSGISDPDDCQAMELEKNTGVTVLRHSIKKPGTYPSILGFFIKQNADDTTVATTTKTTTTTNVTHPSQIVIVGDRLFTDVMMANMMGSWSVWIRDGIEPDRNVFPRIERRLEPFLRRRGYLASIPRSTTTAITTTSSTSPFE